ncbi:GTP-binding protein GEM-like [Mytilus californianus]|uniref:GTP-binding protein GEM-like n=1 Tax=Mytilus californianus TaxID=6549 RepID=UPI00224835DA|nr:GTP-binding protein GEM-like [Mytilus californianus]
MHHNLQEVEEGKLMYFDKMKRVPSPLIGDHNCSVNNEKSINPRPRARSTSMKKTKNKTFESYEIDGIRPRTSSLPTKNNYRRPLIKNLRTNYEDQDHDLYRLRTFEMTSKGIVNRGDSIKSRSTNSIVSSEGDGNTLSIGSSSCSQNSLANSEGSLQRPKPYKIVILGALGVGKSTIVQQFLTSEYRFDISIDSQQEKMVSVLLDAEESTMEFIDLESELCDHEEGAFDCYVVVYSIDDRNTFDRGVDILYNLRHEKHINYAMILVGNKSDLVRTRIIQPEEAKPVAVQYDCKFIETSTVLNINIDELLVGILKQIRLKHKQEGRERLCGAEVGCINKSKTLLTKIFGKNTLSKSCDNLYVL